MGAVGISDSQQAGAFFPRLAVSRLMLTRWKVDDGILDTADAHGNITFTPNAKKTYV